MEKPPPEEANISLGCWGMRNVLYAPLPGEGAVVQERPHPQTLGSNQQGLCPDKLRPGHPPQHLEPVSSSVPWGFSI